MDIDREVSKGRKLHKLRHFMQRYEREESGSRGKGDLKCFSVAEREQNEYQIGPYDL